MKDALAITRVLLARETPHEIVRLRCPITNASELPDVLGLPPGRCLRTLMYCEVPGAKPRHLTAVIVPARVMPELASIKAATGESSMRPAPAGLVNAITEYAAHLVAPLLLPESVDTLADQALLTALRAEDVVYTATGEPCTALAIRAFDLFALCPAKPVELTTSSVAVPRPRRSSRDRPRTPGF